MKRILWYIIFLILCIPTFIKITFWAVRNFIFGKDKEKENAECCPEDAPTIIEADKAESEEME